VSNHFPQFTTVISASTRIAEQSYIHFKCRSVSSFIMAKHIFFLRLALQRNKDYFMLFIYKSFFAHSKLQCIILMRQTEIAPTSRTTTTTTTTTTYNQLIFLFMFFQTIPESLIFKCF